MFKILVPKPGFCFFQEKLRLHIDLALAANPQPASRELTTLRQL